MTDARRFGEELRRQRQERNVTLSEISRQTKVSESLYAALERGDCSRWPSGIYSRSYVRDYAVAVGLDPDRVVAEFATCFVETAVPDGDATTFAMDRSRAAAGLEPLRLSLAMGPGELLCDAAKRCVAVAAEVLLLGAFAAAIALAAGVQYAQSLAGVALTWLAVGRLLPVFGCAATAGGLTSLRWLTLARARLVMRLRSASGWREPSNPLPSGEPAPELWWPRPHQRS